MKVWVVYCDAWGDWDSVGAALSEEKAWEFAEKYAKEQDETRRAVWRLGIHPDLPPFSWEREKYYYTVEEMEVYQ